MRVVCMADLHGHIPWNYQKPEDAALLLIGGDLLPSGHVLDQAKWLDTEFRTWLESWGAVPCVVVAGNHDWLLAKTPQLVPSLPWYYLQDYAINLYGYRIYGTPWQPVFMNDGFNLEEWELERKWSNIPDDTNILLLHGPPHLHGDLCLR